MEEAFKVLLNIAKVNKRKIGDSDRNKMKRDKLSLRQYENKQIGRSCYNTGRVLMFSCIFSRDLGQSEIKSEVLE